MSPLDPALIGVAPETAQRVITTRTGSPDAEWLREFQRAQWAALGENLDRDSPTSAAQPRDLVRERIAHERYVSERQGADRDHRDAAIAHHEAQMVGPTPGWVQAVPGAALRSEANTAVAAAAAHQIDVTEGGALDMRAKGTALDMRAKAMAIGEGVSQEPSSPRQPEMRTDAGSPARTDARAATTSTPPSPVKPVETIAATASMAKAASASIGQSTRAATPRGVAGNAAHAMAPVASMFDAAPLTGAADEPAEAPRGATTSARHDPLAPRTMRVFAGDDGAQVFVRDASLDRAAAHALVARVAAELALSGTRLAALTVNGRAVFEAAALRGGRGGVSPVSKPNDDPEGR